jgi:hypothetical protein
MLVAAADLLRTLLNNTRDLAGTSPPRSLKGLLGLLLSEDEMGHELQLYRIGTLLIIGGALPLTLSASSLSRPWREGTKGVLTVALGVLGLGTVTLQLLGPGKPSNAAIAAQPSPAPADAAETAEPTARSGTLQSEGARAATPYSDRHITYQPAPEIPEAERPTVRFTGAATMEVSPFHFPGNAVLATPAWIERVWPPYTGS